VSWKAVTRERSDVVGVAAALPAAAGCADGPDLADVRGQHEALEALVIAAAGGHNLLMSGPPGAGKTMLARRLPSILPPMTRAEAIEVTRIHSVAGLHAGGGLVAARQSRAPHHMISPSRIAGGGATPRPGGVPGPQRRAVPRRAAGVPAVVAGSAAPAAGGRRVVIVRAQRSDLPDPDDARRGDEPVPVRPRRHAGCRCTDPNSPATARLSGPLLIASTCWSR
jgi:magnesium chelatase family protein